ncbi:MAG TPA: hypothetical protein VJ950_05265 [Acidimicrobiia bacterium]|jgi:hypothetical protein|nr:hypothetical protein [Acidimicrobiia bacterium]
MGEMVMVAVDVPQVGDERHKNWAKVVESVDDTRASGWAFDGPFVATGGIQDLPMGATLLVYGERGSRANPQITARVYTVNPDSTLTLEAEAKGKAWARTLRDPVERCLGADARAPDLSFISDELLALELKSRGWNVERP